MATAVLERMTYEQNRDQRLGLIPCTPVTDYDLVMKDPVTGQHSYGRYIGTIMPSPPPGPPPPYQNGSYQNGSYQNGSYQNGSYQNGSYQNGSYQNGSYQNGSYQNGAYPPPPRVTFLTEPSYAANDMYPSKEIDGYERAPPPHDYSINAPRGSALPLTPSLMRPASAMGAADNSYHNQQDFRPISPSYRPMQRPKSAVAWLGGSRGPAAGRRTDAKPVHQSTAFTVEEIPIEQYYELTPLRKSHVRNDDQLVPRPEACEVSKHAINRPFPASHPLSSHTVEKAVFPKFAETPDDPRTGAEARRTLPKGTNVPGNPADVIVVKKTKGHGERHEIQHHPATNKPPLYWPGDNGFDQQVKMHGGRPQYFPAPTKTYVPNLEPRSSDMQISERTANALMNVERDQWTTTYNRDNTGYGSIHTMALDNFQDKVAKYRATGGEIDDTLTPRSVPVFDPARPVEGRVARHLTFRPAPQVNDDDWKARPYTEPRKMTDSEIEEQRLLSGREYLNLPEGKQLDLVYTSRNMQQELPKDNQYGKPAQKGEGEENEEQDAAVDERTDDSKLQQRYDFQQMEASNRWRELQSSKPNHDIEALRVKYTKLEEKEKPNVFYNHEGQYQEERAGMYQTDYIPEKLASTLRKPHEPAYSIQSNSYCLTDDNTDVLRAYSGIRHRDIPNISGRVLPSQVLEPEILRKYQQKMQITPSGLTSRPEVQEGGFIGRESEYQDHYNTEKILQERQMHPLARSEPSILMSHENQKLNNVRDFSLRRSKSVHFSNDVTVATGAGGEPIRLSSAPMNGQEDGEQYRRRIEETMRQKEQELREQAYLDGVTLNDSQAASSQAMFQPNFTYSPVNQSYHTKLKRGNYGGTVDDMFVSKSSNFMPSGITAQESKSSYESQFPRSYSLNFKDDPRFHWRPGMGRPRPRSELMAIQDSFSKTNVMNEFNNTFPEGHCDLRSHVRTGKKHVFDGVHAQTFRGN